MPLSKPFALLGASAAEEAAVEETILAIEDRHWQAVTAAQREVVRFIDHDPAALAALYAYERTVIALEAERLDASYTLGRRHASAERKECIRAICN